MVHNDFKSSEGIFEIFLGPSKNPAAQVSGSLNGATLNGVSKTIGEMAGNTAEKVKELISSLNGQSNGLASN